MSDPIDYTDPATFRQNVTELVEMDRNYRVETARPRPLSGNAEGRGRRNRARRRTQLLEAVLGPTRAHRARMEYGSEVTLADLASRSDSELLDLRGFGPKLIQNIRDHEEALPSQLSTCSSILEESIDKVDTTVRINRQLKQAGIKTIRQLINFTPSELLYDVEGLLPSSVEQIQQELLKLSLGLTPEEVTR